MSEFDIRGNDLSSDIHTREFVDQDVSGKEIAVNAEMFLREWRALIFSWPEFQSAVSQKFIHQKHGDSRSLKFQRAGIWFILVAGEEQFDVTWADNEDALKEDGWNAEGGRIERIHSRTIGITYEARPFRSDKHHGSLFYEGPEIKIPTRTFTVPANTRAVVEQIEKGFVELRKI